MFIHPVMSLAIFIMHAVLNIPKIIIKTPNRSAHSVSSHRQAHIFK